MEDLCNLTILRESTIKSNKIITTSLFQLQKSYKNIKIYVNGIIKAAQKRDIYFPDFKLILFIDNTIYYSIFYSKLKQLNYEIILYECKLFKINTYHCGLFGTLIRFMPFFDFEQFKYIKIVITLDADSPYTLKSMKQYYDYLIKIKKQTYFHYITGYLYAEYVKWKRDDYIPPILANKIITNYKFSNKILSNYLFSIKKEIHHLSIKNIFPNYNQFPYGIDEFFLNYHLIDYLLKNNLEFSFTLLYSVPNLILDSYSQSETTFNQFATYLLPSNNNNKFELLSEIFKEYLDSYTITTKTKEIIIKFYQVIEQFKHTNNYKIFTKSIIQKILTNKNYILFNKFVLINGKKTNENIIKEIKL